MGVNYEYTIPGTQQQNEQAERKYATLLNWVHAMLNSGKFLLFSNDLWAEAANTAMLFENNSITSQDNQASFNLLCKTLVKCGS